MALPPGLLLATTHKTQFICVLIEPVFSYTMPERNVQVLWFVAGTPRPQDGLKRRYVRLDKLRSLEIL